MRRYLGAAALAAALGANAQQPALSPFGNIAAREVQQVIPRDVTISPAREASPTFYAVEFNRLEEVRCEQQATFGLITKANLAAHVLVASCAREANRVHILARDAQQGLATVTRELRGSGMKIDDPALAKMNWTFHRAEVADGLEYHFPVILIGHGILSQQTVVFLPRDTKRAVVVQADLYRLCDRYGLEATPLCADPRKVLSQLARRMAARAK